MPTLLDVLGDIVSPMLTALEEADHLVSEAIDKIGEGVEWSGDEVVALSHWIAELGPKLAALKAKL